jgi:hypothetical protein
MPAVAKQFAENLGSAASGAKALNRQERLDRSAESAAPPKSEFFRVLWNSCSSRFAPRLKSIRLEGPPFLCFFHPICETDD